MSKRERIFITAILAFIVAVMAADLVTDSSEGVIWWHLIAEAFVALFALLGIFFLLRGSLALKHSLVEERKINTQLQAESEKWRAESKRYLEGLSLTIDQQLTSWKLTSSEKEVAFLLLKGLSLKEIANIRNTTEKTARTQSISIYSKAGLSGRSELAAFFLEDLLPPVESERAGQRGDISRSLSAIGEKVRN